MRSALYVVDTPAPGRLATMAHPRGGDWLEDECAGLADAGVDLLVSALTDSELQELSLAQLDNLVSPPPNVRGTISGRWNIRLPQFDVNRMTVEGDYALHNVARLNPPPPTTSPARC